MSPKSLVFPSGENQRSAGVLVEFKATKQKISEIPFFHLQRTKLICKKNFCSVALKLMNNNNESYHVTCHNDGKRRFGVMCF